jgi:6-pyruvoyl-tetrahydropterin synthase
MVSDLERLQVLTEIVSEFRFAILNDNEPEKTGRLVLEVVQEARDDKLQDMVLNAYLKLTDRETAIRYLNEARDYLYEKIDVLLN